MVRVDKKVPVPAARKVYPWKEIKVGESFFCDNPHARSNLYHAASYHKIKIKTAIDGDGIRVWRVK